MKILVVSPIDRSALARLGTEHEVVCALNPTAEEFAERVADVDALIFRSGVVVDGDLLSRAPRLQLLLRAGAGTDNVDLGALRDRGLTLVTVPEPGAKAVAEMSFALMLALARNVLEADRRLRKGEWAKHELTGHALCGRTLGVVGAGNIGSRVGRLASLWDMEVLGCVEYPNPRLGAALAADGIRLTDFDEVLSRSDYVSVHVPLKDSTRNLIDGQALAQMRRGAFFINLARGGVVDEEALRVALVEGRLGGAALDVHRDEGNGVASPLADLPNVVLTPHIGAGTVDAQREIGNRVLRIVEDFAAGRPIQDAVPQRLTA